jgi:tetratricopeptide (TPR) repeat protein
VTPPAYLGRVRTADGVVAGTCFQVAPSILVTAQHVLSGDVLVDNFGDEIASARVLRADPVHDLAVLRVERPFAASVTGLSVTDAERLTSSVVVTGACEVDDSGRGYSHLDAPGSWSGGTTRDGVPLGRLSSTDVLLGMSGAPVRRLGDDVVVGVVSGRYNSADGWLRDSVWVARVEDLQPLLAGLVDVAVGGRPLGPIVDLVLEVSTSTVRLRGPGIDLIAEHGGVGFGLRSAVRERQPRRAGRLLAESFLPEPLSGALADVLRRADAADTVVRLGLDAADFAMLPWEALPNPVDGRPLALSRLVVVYRRAPAPQPRPIRGPLRLVVAIASPDDASPVLDFERELRNVLAAVRGARQGEAQVRLVPFATTSAIRAELAAGPAHVLHMSGHGRPGELLLEDDDGAGRPVTAEVFVEEAIPPGAMPPVVALSACHAHESPSFSAALLRCGASVVIGAEASVSDRYGTRLFARVYNELASSAQPDVLAAVAEARRIVQRELESAKDPLADRDEWSVITVHTGGAAILFDPAASETLPPPARQSLRGLLDRGVGEFVGRRREQRELPTLLLGTATSGVLLYGIGGVGKTTLAAQLVRRIQSREPARRAIVLNGELSVDAVFTKVAVTLRRAGLPAAAEFVSRLDERWQDRFDALREDVLDNLPLLLVLDNFDDNLTDNHTGNQIRDAALAGLLAAWSRDPGRSRLLITSRHPVGVPGLTLRPVGPLSLAETLKLIWSLPALDALEPTDIERVWRLVGGHPRTLEYLDALLTGGRARFHDVTERLARAVDTTALAATPTLDAALAQSITLAANEVLLDQLLATLPADVERHLVELSVYREPIEISTDLSTDLTLLEASSLVTLDGGRAFVHRWTATELARRWTADHHADDLAAAHRQAAQYWRRRVKTLKLENAAVVHDLLEARHHLLAAGDRAEGFVITEAALLVLDGMGAPDHAFELTRDTLRWVELDSPQQLAMTQRLGVLAQGWGDYSEAERCYQQALEISKRLNVAAGMATCSYQLGKLAKDRGNYADAEHHYRRALEISEQSNAMSGMTAAVYHEFGNLAESRGDYDEAERRYHQALEISEQLGNRYEMSATIGQLGMLAHDRGDHQEAERRYRQARKIAENVNNPAQLATFYHQEGVLAHDLGKYAEAEDLYRSSLEIDLRMGDQAGIAANYGQLGLLAMTREDYPEAERLYQQSLAIKERLRDQAGVATTLTGLGLLAMARKRLGDAVGFNARALLLRLTHDLPHVHYNTALLVSLRRHVGSAAFNDAAGRVLDTEQITRLNDQLPR